MQKQFPWRKRFFGQPPMRDSKVRRLAGSAMVSD
jgi:hypothetical protein